MEPFLAQTILFAGNFAPRGWALCEGQILPINQNQALFSLLGTVYGGDGRTTFALPDLRGRVPVHVGTIAQGAKGGSATTTLVSGNLPPAAISIPASSDDPNSDEPAGRAPAITATNAYHTAGTEAMAPGSIIGAANQSFNNMQPSLGLNYIICLQGTFPSRN